MLDYLDVTAAIATFGIEEAGLGMCIQCAQVHAKLQQSQEASTVVCAYLSELLLFLCLRLLLLCFFSYTQSSTL